MATPNTAQASGGMLRQAGVGEAAWKDVSKGRVLLFLFLRFSEASVRLVS
jgi:hypothetical protein